MHKTLLSGAAAALFAAAMGASGSAAALPQYPTTACTAENEGELTTVDIWNPRTGYSQRIYQCDSGNWSLVAYCDQNGCVYY